MMSLLASVGRGRALSGGRLAEFNSLPATTTAKAMQALANAGLVGGRKGRAGGYYLERDPKEISVAEIVRAVSPDPGFQCSEIRQQGPCRHPDEVYSPRCAIAATMDAAQQQWWRHLEGVSLAEMTSRVVEQLDPIEIDLATKWLSGKVKVVEPDATG
jgi:Rrf2 family protein